MSESLWRGFFCVEGGRESVHFVVTLSWCWIGLDCVGLGWVMSGCVVLGWVGLEDAEHTHTLMLSSDNMC